MAKVKTKVENTEEVEQKQVQAEPTTKPCSSNEIPGYVSEILKHFSFLENAYVDDKGGVYTIETPEHIRGNAVCYKNPHYKS